MSHSAGESRSLRRVSQRASRSCTECKRRKVRCDKRTPCDQCRRHGIQERCGLEIVELSTRSTKSREELSFLRSLQRTLSSDHSNAKQDAQVLVERRIHFLETGCRIQAANKPRREAASSEKSRQASNEQDDQATETAMALMRLGRGYPGSADMPDDKLLICWPDSLPEPSRTTQLVEYYLEELGWHHNVLDSGLFKAQYLQFCASREALSQQWLSLLFAVLAAAAWNLPEDVSWDIHGVGHLRQEAALWYDQAINILTLANYTANHSIEAIQSILISSMVAHPLGHGVRHVIQLASCLRIAQCLGLSEVREETSDETSKRVWWQLLVQDYFLVPMAGSYSVSPDHFTTPMPKNCDDGQDQDEASDMPTVASYGIALSKMALIMPQLIDGLRSPTSTRETQYAHVQRMDSLMRSLMADLPGFLRPGVTENPKWPSWVSTARSAITFSAADKIIMIHRSFLVKSLQEPNSYEFTRTTCLRAANTILNEFQRIKGSSIVKLWVIPTFTVSAAIVLYLDLLYKTKRDEVLDEGDVALLVNTITELKVVDFDHNAKRGVTMLETLVNDLTLPRNVFSPNEKDTPRLDMIFEYFLESSMWE